ncbi:MAG: hypothetical protein ABJM86_11905 [Hyphomicrobiales bacterium]
MKKVILATAAMILVSAGTASADFKVAEFTFGQEGSLKNTVSQSLEDYAGSNSQTQKSDAVEINSADFGDLFKNLKIK